jgi:hypothetical protein
MLRHTPSKHAEAIRTHLARGVSRSAVLAAAATAVPYCLQVQIGPYVIDVRVTDRKLFDALEARYRWARPTKQQKAVFALWVVDYLTAETNLAIVGPSRMTLVGSASKVCFGVQDDEIEEIFGGSFGDRKEAGSHVDSETGEAYFVHFLIDTELISALKRAVPNLDFAHASAISKNGLGVLLAGQSGAGKTTIAVGCAMRDFVLLAEDVACASLARANLYPFLGQPRIRPSANPLLDRLGQSEPHTAPAASSHRLGIVCLLDGFGDRCQVRKLCPSDGAWQLARHVLLRRDAAGVTMSRIAELLSHVPCYALTCGPLEETIDVVRELADRASDIGSTAPGSGLAPICRT